MFLRSKGSSNPFGDSRCKDSDNEFQQELPGIDEAANIHKDFGKSAEELFLLAVAVKYAAVAGKTVTIIN